jgi:hypothetical protein
MLGQFGLFSCALDIVQLVQIRKNLDLFIYLLELDEEKIPQLNDVLFLKCHGDDNNIVNLDVKKTITFIIEKSPLFNNKSNNKDIQKKEIIEEFICNNRDIEHIKKK